jgi:hypothetical protein
MLSRLTATLVALDQGQESGRARGEPEGGAELELSRILSCVDAPRQWWPDGWARPTHTQINFANISDFSVANMTEHISSTTLTARLTALTCCG